MDKDEKTTNGTAVKVVNFEEYAMLPEAITGQVKLIQTVMKSVMKKGEHYGTIPGCGNKPTLLKPGAEKLSTTFRFAPKYDITRLDLAGGHREYEIICSLKHIPTGQFIGQGVGCCSTMEAKFRFRKGERLCPTCKMPAIIKGKEEFGGGWICYKAKDGCGAKFKDGDKVIEDQEVGRIEHDNPADYYNTVLKMGKKRAHIDAVLTATAASDIFTQDIEDLPRDPNEDSHQDPQNRRQPNSGNNKSAGGQGAPAGHEAQGVGPFGAPAGPPQQKKPDAITVDGIVLGLEQTIAAYTLPESWETLKDWLNGKAKEDKKYGDPKIVDWFKRNYESFMLAFEAAENC